MGLLEIKNYLMNVKIASLSSLCAYFNCDAQLLKHMLGHWIRKGCVRQCGLSNGCGKTCGGCKVGSGVEIYEWVSYSL